MTQPHWGSTWRNARRLAVPLAGGGLLLLAGCGSGGPTVSDPPTVTPAAVVVTATEPPAAPAGTPLPTPTPRPAGLGAVRWSSDEPGIATPAAGTTLLAAEAPRLVASVPAYSLPPGSQVTAAWFYNNTSLDAFTTTVTTEAPQAEQWLAFQLTRTTETPWPAGTYEIVVSLNGEQAQQASVEIVSPS
ncbi:MAG: hypothetical protein QM692_21955 [Thermomicrobiales bacterium]